MAWWVLKEDPRREDSVGENTEAGAVSSLEGMKEPEHFRRVLMPAWSLLWQMYLLNNPLADPKTVHVARDSVWLFVF